MRPLDLLSGFLLAATVAQHRRFYDTDSIIELLPLKLD